jgi:hypothetical protein
MAFHFSPRIVKDGLVLYLDAANTKSYPSTGDIWNDLSGNMNNGTLLGTPTFNTSNGGNIDFDGINDYTNIPNAASEINDLNISIGCWINQNTIHTSNVFNEIKMIAQLSATEPGNSSTFYLHLRNSGVIWRYQRGSNQFNFSPAATQEIGKWAYYVGVSDTNNISLYKNGLLVGSTANNVSYLTLANNDINLAKGEFDNTFFDGKISNVQIYNRSLSSSEVLQNYNSIKSRYGLW